MRRVHQFENEALTTMSSLARLAWHIASASVTPHMAARQLLRLLTGLCAASRGALVFVSPPTAAAPPAEAYLTCPRSLALWRMNEAAVKATLASLPPSAETWGSTTTRAWIADESVHWLAFPLLGGAIALTEIECARLANQAEKITHHADLPHQALLLLGWDPGPRIPSMAQVVAHAQAVLPLIADGAGAVITSLSLAERSRILEAAKAQAMAQLQQAEQTCADWVRTLDAVSDPIRVMTPASRVLYANAAYTAYASYARLLGDRPLHACDACASGGAAPNPCLGCPLPRSVETHRPAFARHKRWFPTGAGGALTRHLFETWTFPVFAHNGTVDRVVEILKDVTDQEHLREAQTQAEALREADRLKAELLGTVSHELRTPLAAIKGYAATLLRHEQRLPRAERREFLAAIDEASNRLDTIIENLLEMSQLNTGALKLEPVLVDVAHIAREALAARQQRSQEAYQ
nr:PAS domain-containing protein [Ktedonobacterales bacterium]